MISFSPLGLQIVPMRALPILKMMKMVSIPMHGSSLSCLRDESGSSLPVIPCSRVIRKFDPCPKECSYDHQHNCKLLATVVEKHLVYY